MEDAWKVGLGLSIAAAVALAVAGLLVGTRRRRASPDALAKGVVLGNPQMTLLLSAFFWVMLAGASWMFGSQEQPTAVSWVILVSLILIVVLGLVLVVANWRNVVVFREDAIFIRFMNETTVPWADYVRHYLASSGVVEIVVHDPDSYRAEWPLWRRAMGRFDPNTAVTVSPNTLTVSVPEFLQLLDEHAAKWHENDSSADTQAP